MKEFERVEAALRALTAEADPDFFIVDIKLHRGAKSVLSVLVDKDSGIKIDEVARLSRKFGRYFEEEDPLDFPFNLEVGSPGVGSPLKVHRQYIQNIGRKLKVVQLDETVTKGKLLEVTDEHIVLEQTPKKKSKKSKKDQEPEDPMVTIGFDSIKEAKVEISFD